MTNNTLAYRPGALHYRQLTLTVSFVTLTLTLNSLIDNFLHRTHATSNHEINKPTGYSKYYQIVRK